jgi:hypothetical protein
VLLPTFGNPTMPASMIKFSLANGNSQTHEYNHKAARRTKSRRLSKLRADGLAARMGRMSHCF